MGTFYSPNCHYVYIVQENHWLMTNICWHMILVSKGLPLPFGKKITGYVGPIFCCVKTINLPFPSFLSLNPSYSPFLPPFFLLSFFSDAGYQTQGHRSR